MECRYLVMGLFVTMAMPLANCMERQDRTTMPRPTGIASALYRGIQHAFPIAAPVQQSRLNKIGSLLVTHVLGEYFSGLEEIGQRPDSSRWSLLSILEFVGQWFARCNKLLDFRNKASYFLGYDEEGKLHRCYAVREPENFQSMLNRSRVFALLDHTYKGPRVDGRAFARNLLVELGAVGLTALVNSCLLKNLRIPAVHISPFVRGVAARMVQSLLYSGIKSAVVEPIINFADRVQQKGFRAACDAHWYQPLYQVS